MKAPSRKNDIIELVGEKFERRLTEELGKLRQELKEDIASLRAEMNEGYASLRVEMREFKSEIVKWMFIFWIGQLIAIVGIIFTMLR